MLALHKALVALSLQHHLISLNFLHFLVLLRLTIRTLGKQSGAIPISVSSSILLYNVLNNKHLLLHTTASSNNLNNPHKIKNNPSNLAKISTAPHSSQAVAMTIIVAVKEEWGN